MWTIVIIGFLAFCWFWYQFGLIKAAAANLKNHTEGKEKITRETVSVISNTIAFIIIAIVVLYFANN